MPPNFNPLNTPPEGPTPLSRPNLPPPTPNPLRQDHSMPIGEQHTVDVNNLPKNSGNNLFQNDSPKADPTAPDYDFILNPNQPKPSKKLSLPGGTLGKIVLGLAGVLALIIIFAIISSLLKSPSNVPYLTSVLEDQQEIVHISSNAANEPDISGNNQNFVSTAGLALSTNMKQLESYLAVNGHAVNVSALSLKVNSSVDQQLTNAESSGDFNSTFDQVAKTELTIYQQDLKAAYTKTSGPNGRALLNSFFNQANLLLVALNNGS